MKIHLIKKQTIEEFSHHHSGCLEVFDEWLERLKEVDLETPADIKKYYPTADLLGGGSERIIFDIGDNNFRMICRYRFGITMVRLYVGGLEHMTNMISYVKTTYNTQYNENSYEILLNQNQRAIF